MIMGDQKISRKRLAQLTEISRPSLANKLDAQVPFTYDELTRVVDALGLQFDALFAAGADDSPLGDAAKNYEPLRISQFGPHPGRKP